MGSKENGEERENETERETNSKQIKENGDDSDYEPARDSLSSQEDSLAKTPNKKPSKTPNKKTNNNSSTFLRPTKSSANRINNAKSQIKPSQNDIHKKTQKLNRNTGTKTHENKKNDTKIPSRPSSEISEETDEKTIEIDGNITNTDDELEDNKDADITISNFPTENKKIIQQMETKIEKLEQELREVAALEISIYSIVPEHMCSVNKVHTPARRLSRLYIRACTNWETDKKASVGKNIVNGVVLVAKSCGNDVSRLTYWLSNTVVLREIISQTFGNISSPKIQTVTNSNSNSNGFKGKNLGIFLPIDDWRETCTFISALEKIESWIFSRIVESVWWQALTPHMQSPNEDPNSNNTAKHLGPILGDPKQGNFSIELWKSAFQDAFMKLCPLRSSGHECGCLPILAKMVMEECVGRLDIAMFNAILRESASEIPTDPVSDPIVDTKVLPIPAGHLSFGSGAQLKNSIGNWSRWLSDNFGMDSDDSPKEEYSDKDSNSKEEYSDTESSKKSKTFCLLNELSDLLMLPKDLLLEKSIRKEVCPSIALSLAIRILCNFTPDEFCPDPVPGIVLEELNSESMAERLSDKILLNIFPYTASKVTYNPPSPADVAQKASPSPADVAQNASDTSNTKSREFERKASMVQRRGYTSDDDLDDLDSPLKAFIERTPPVTPMSDNGGVGNNGKEEGVNGNLRYKLLREVWCD